MDSDELLTFDLDENERSLLRWGVNGWGGPARPTEALAVAMGFDGVRQLSDERRRLMTAIERAEPLMRLDWFRVLAATEFVFASDLFGSGSDWQFTTGMSDEDSIRTLRGVQRKLVGPLRGFLHDGPDRFASVSARVRRRIARDFGEGAVVSDVVARVSAVSDTERIQAAIVVCAGGSVEALEQAVALARLDWRDLLVNAGLAGADWPDRLVAEVGPNT